jgi:uncharacterized protein (DUF4415 family)
MPEIHCQECNAWAATVKHLEELLSPKNAICNERIADMLAQDAAASGHQFTDAADTFKTVVEQQKKEIEGLRNDRDNLREAFQQLGDKLQGAINTWKFILNESTADNMVYHKYTIAAVISDLQAVLDGGREASNVN